MRCESWKDFFDEHYAFFADAILTPERTLQEVDALQRMFREHGLNGRRILDFGCGQGRIAVPLAQRGYDVTGLDGSAALLEKAQQYADRAGVTMTWVCEDMRTNALTGPFDAVINMGTAFGYVEDEANEKIMRQWHSLLDDGGILVMDTENAEFVLRKRRGHTRHDMKDVTVDSHRSYDKSTKRWREELTWSVEDKVYKKVLDLRLYTPIELSDLLRECGFAVEVYGGVDKTRLTEDSARLVLVATKNA